MYVQNSLKDAKLQEQFQQDIIDKVKLDRARLTKERDSIAKHLAQLNAQYSVVAEKSTKLRTQNQAAAIQINRLQLEAAKQINNRVQNMVSVL